MADLLDRKRRLTGRARSYGRRRGAPIAPISPPALDEPKTLFAAIRAMVTDDYFAANLSRAVVQSYKDWYDEPSEIAGDEIDELTGDRHANLTRARNILWIGNPPQTRHRSIFDNAKRLDKRGQTDSALDIIFDQIDEMLLAEQFDRVNQLLVDIATNDFSAELLLGVLTATLPAKDRLPNRAELFERVAEALRARGELEDGLLVGLE